MNEENLHLLKVMGIEDQEYIVALVEGGGHVTSLGTIVEGPHEGWAFTYPAHASWHLWLENKHLHQITEWVSNLNKYGSPEMFSEEDPKPEPPTILPHPDMETPKPDWANWLAMDDDGAWYWYASRPSWDECVDEWGVSDEFVDDSASYTFAGVTRTCKLSLLGSLYYVGPKGEDHE